jgi:hypothetical protein
MLDRSQRRFSIRLTVRCHVRMASVSAILRGQFLQVSVGVFYACQPEILAGLSHQRGPLFAAEVKQDCCNSAVLCFGPGRRRQFGPWKSASVLSTSACWPKCQARVGPALRGRCILRAEHHGRNSTRCLGIKDTEANTGAGGLIAPGAMATDPTKACTPPGRAPEWGCRRTGESGASPIPAARQALPRARAARSPPPRRSRPAKPLQPEDDA